MDKGFIKLSRKFFENDIWKVARTYNESEAWLDLIQSARFEASETTSRVGGRDITWGMGQYPASNRFLASRWHWSEQKVKSFLVKLKKKGMVTTDCTQGMNIITLTNYKEYNCNLESPPNSPADSPLNYLNINELRDIVAQQVAQQVAQCEESGQNGGKQQPTGNPKNKKGKNIGDNISLNPKKETSPDGEAKKDGLSLGVTGYERIDYQGLMDYYNRLFSGKLPTIKFMTDARRKDVKARIAQYGKEAVMQVFANILESPFLLGDNDRKWTCNFDWIFKQANFTKILEKRYNGQRTDNNSARRESVSRLKDLAGAILRGAAPGEG